MVYNNLIFVKYSMYVVVTQARIECLVGMSSIVAGTGNYGHSNGKSNGESFSQSMDVCVEMDKNIFANRHPNWYR